MQFFVPDDHHWEKDMLRKLVRFVFLALTDASMLPALHVMKRNRRHFELFIGILQFVISFLFNAADAFDMELFLKEDEWHFISDVVSVTYFLLLCVHVMGYKEENVNIALRYLAFAGSWIFKTKDRWDSTFYEELLAGCYLVGVIYRRGFAKKTEISAFSKKHGLYALLNLVAAVIMEFSVIYYDEDEGHMAWGFVEGLMHILAGTASYYAWLSVPCMDSKKDDVIPTHSSFM